jgi:hypothetical protein
VAQIANSVTELKVQRKEKKLVDLSVLNVTALRANAHVWIPIVIIASLILAAPLAWWIAPRLQARYDSRRGKG